MSKLTTLRDFVSRVGQRVYRTSNGCNCEMCERVVKEGIVIKDKMHADYMYSSMCDCNAEGGLQYHYYTRKQDIKNLSAKNDQ